MDVDFLFQLIAANQGGGGGSRYWRILVTASSGNDPFWGVRLSEMSFKGTPGGADLTSPAEAVARSSASLPAAGSTTSSDKAFDDNPGTYWIFPNGNDLGPRWLSWEFASAQVINELTWVNDTNALYHIQDMVVQSSPDGSTWTDEWSEAGLPATNGGTITTTRP
ncbi:hypothetical protein PhaeoP48_01220 [Phaeobacter inhibens]|uniref:discoidin domain-containing protein n=1 Tax=Phaeobacter inhibens TaxID=221822 RepID=UPI000C9B1140|nr:discoidin domain-containing protein [Phaeobacter inhibens]AUR11217.1 hypothetical protein PhaeoP48_01220 [Phaeobacter inhibens]